MEMPCNRIEMVTTVAKVITAVSATVSATVSVMDTKARRSGNSQC
jgi:hypothetical protein